MASLNRVEIIGTLVAKPELRFTPTGRPVANFIVQVEREQLLEPGYLDTVISSLPIMAWGELAEVCEKYLQKGSSVYLEGYLNSPKTKLTTTVHDDEFGDYELDMSDSFVQVVVSKIELLGNSPQMESITGNKEKIWKAITQLEAQAGDPLIGSWILDALTTLKSIDLETID